jgi:hypothetical protein
MKINFNIIPFFKIVFFAIILSFTACKKGSDIGGGITPPPLPPPAVSPIEMSFTETISGVAESDRLNQSLPASDFSPVGIYVSGNATLKINIEQLSGTNVPKLLIGTYSRLKAKNNPQEFQLTVGVNNLTADALGGLVFIRFINNNPAGSRVKITFQTGFKKAPFFVLGTTTEADWDSQLSMYTESPDVVLESLRTFMVMSREKALEYKTQDQGNILRKADEILDIEDNISGMDGSVREHERIKLKYLMTETDNTDYYMFANWYRTAYVYTTGAQYAFSNKLFSNEGWGPWHELGHMHQQRWTWSTVVETTVNIYSLAVEQGLGYTPNRLVRDNKWVIVDPYFTIPNRDFNSSQIDVWGRLLMFRQLSLAFGDDFYRALHKIARIEKASLSGDQAKMRYFMLKACSVSGKNLTNFFRQWGLPVPQSVYDEISALNLPNPTIEPSTLRE